MRSRDGNAVGDRGMGVEDLFDLTRRDGLAAADDDVLDPVSDGQSALVVHVAEIAGAKPAVGGECLSIQSTIVVADELIGTAHDDLAIYPDRAVRTIRPDDANLGARQRFAISVPACPLRLTL